MAGVLRLTAVLALSAAVAGALDAGMSPGARAAEPVRHLLVIKNRKAEGGQKTVRIRRGDMFELTATADEPVDLHLHGYDRYLDVQPGAPATLRLEAKTAGRFPLEAHRFGPAAAAAAAGSPRHVVLLYLEVHPR